MKRILSFGMVLILLLAILVGCDRPSEISYEDGNYTAETEPDDRGYKSVIDITVENGEIVEVYYDEMNEEGDRKSQDQEYSDKMEQASGVRPEDAYKQLQDALINTQNPDQIDAVTGATTSSETFKKLAKEALDN